MDAVELIAYPLVSVPCPLCASPRHRLPSGVARIGRCTRCNGAGIVFRSPAPEPVTTDHNPEAA